MKDKIDKARGERIREARIGAKIATQEALGRSRRQTLETGRERHKVPPEG